ncbi:MAG: divergent polysaccharide deacetylase family protein [candidate division NC10 bacterium]|nr:divergent polysaccharide deacetylase family protein [candidate division NC10 bacterium]
MNRKRFLLLLILVLLLLGGTWWLQRIPRRQEAQQPVVTHEEGKEERAATPSKELPTPPVGEGRPEAKRAGSHRIAIIIDDLGYNGRNYRPFLTIPYPLSLAILPSQPYSERIAREAIGQGKEVLLHLPLEPHGYPEKDPGKGVILSGMSEEEMRRVFSQDLKSIPGAVGVSNHMGSRLMEEEEAMRTLLLEMKRKDLYFVDSVTTRNTIAPQLAKELGVRVGARRIFLDNSPERSYIEGQIRSLSRIAKRDGSAIGVGHPYAITASVLQELLPHLEKEGIDLVPASQLVR